jgi:hypothetical protein
MSSEPGRAGASQSAKWGCLWASLAFLAAGLGFLSLFATRAWRDVRVFSVWQKASCTIVEKSIGSTSRSRLRPAYRPEITFRYQVEGRTYQCTGWDSWAVSGAYGGGSYERFSRVLDRYEIGASYPCWFDPEDPSKAVLVRRVRPLYVLAVLPLALIVLGAMGLHGSLARSVASSFAAETSRPSAQGADAAQQRGSPPVRLKPATMHRTQSGGTVVVALALLFVAVIAGFSARSQWEEGETPILTGLFLVVFGGLGLLVLWTAVAAALASRVPPLVVEMLQPAAAVGESVTVLVRQPGPLQLRSLRLKLVCEELTPAQKGPPSIRVLHEETLAEVGRVRIRADAPLERRLTLRVPAGARPSCEGPAAVQWRLRAWVAPSFAPRFVRTFAIEVSGAAARV